MTKLGANDRSGEEQCGMTDIPTITRPDREKPHKPVSITGQ
jgi:hypothetical protein